MPGPWEMPDYDGGAKVTSYVRTYAVTHLPPDSVNASIWKATVEWRNRNQWAVISMGRCLNADGELVHEPSPSNRSDEFIASTRFDLDTAMAMAEDLADKMVINGQTWRDVVDHPHSQHKPDYDGDGNSGGEQT